MNGAWAARWEMEPDEEEAVLGGAEGHGLHSLGFSPS